MFLPSPEDLLVNLAEKRTAILELLTALPERHGNPSPAATQSALGAALQAAHKLMVIFFIFQKKIICLSQKLILISVCNWWPCYCFPKLPSQYWSGCSNTKVKLFTLDNVRFVFLFTHFLFFIHFIQGGSQ